MHGNFCIILKSHFFICDFIDIDECKGNQSCHEDANCTNTNGSYVCDCQPGYTGNGQNCTGEFGITRECGHRLFLLVRSIFCWLYNVFCAPVAKKELFIAYALDILCCTNVKKFEKWRFDLQVQPENRMKPKNCKWVFHFFHTDVHV